MTKKEDSKIALTTKEITKLEHDEIEKEKLLSQINLKATQKAKRSKTYNNVAKLPNSKIDDMEYHDISVEEQIQNLLRSVNQTPADLAYDSSIKLSRPDQFAIDYYNAKIAPNDDPQIRARDALLLLTRDFNEKMRSLNIDISVIGELNQLLPDEVKEFVVSTWQKFSKEFITAHGKNPYRMTTQQLIQYIQKKYHAENVINNLNPVINIQNPPPLPP